VRKTHPTQLEWWMRCTYPPYIKNTFTVSGAWGREIIVVCAVRTAHATVFTHVQGAEQFTPGCGRPTSTTAGPRASTSVVNSEHDMFAFPDNQI